MCVPGVAPAAATERLTFWWAPAAGCPANVKAHLWGTNTNELTGGGEFEIVAACGEESCRVGVLVAAAALPRRAPAACSYDCRPLLPVDVMYIDEAIPDLVKTLEGLCTKKTVLYVAHGRNRTAGGLAGGEGDEMRVGRAAELLRRHCRLLCLACTPTRLPCCCRGHIPEGLRGQV